MHTQNITNSHTYIDTHLHTDTHIQTHRHTQTHTEREQSPTGFLAIKLHLQQSRLTHDDVVNKNFCYCSFDIIVATDFTDKESVTSVDFFKE